MGAGRWLFSTGSGRICWHWICVWTRSGRPSPLLDHAANTRPSRCVGFDGLGARHRTVGGEVSAMEQSTEKPCHKKWKIAAGIFLSVLVLAAGGFFWYVSDYYRAGDVALEVLASGDHLEVRDDLTILSLSYPTDTAIIRFCTGNASETAVSALSLNFATNILSTIL